MELATPNRIESSIKKKKPEDSPRVKRKNKYVVVTTVKNFIPETITEETEKSLDEDSIFPDFLNCVHQKTDVGKITAESEQNIPISDENPLSKMFQRSVCHFVNKKIRLPENRRKINEIINEGIKNTQSFYLFLNRQFGASTTVQNLDALHRDEKIYEKWILNILCELQRQMINFKKIFLNLLDTQIDLQFDLFSVINRFSNVSQEFRKKVEEFLAKHLSYEESSTIVKTYLENTTVLEKEICGIDYKQIPENVDDEKNKERSKLFHDKMVDFQRILYLEESKAKYKSYQEYRIKTFHVLTDKAKFLEEMEELFAKNGKLLDVHLSYIDIFTKLAINMIELQNFQISYIEGKYELFNSAQLVWKELDYLISVIDGLLN